jgi:aspartyl-tRNA(Asn)/glutamyl-tRNA(Gln) amidotransferase subunit A
VVGFKATCGLVPIYGIVPLTLSLDHCGFITRTVEDSAVMLNALAGFDPLDITSVEHPREDYVAAMRGPVEKLRLGLPEGHFDKLEPDVENAVNKAITVLAAITDGTRQVVLPPIGALNTLGALGETLAWHEKYFQEQPGKYMLPERRYLQGLAENPVSATEYIRALWALKMLRRTIDDTFADVDLVVLPTMRVVAPTIELLLSRDADTKPSDPIVYSDCVYFDVYGIPAITVPCGFSNSGLPIGLTIAGPHFSEGRVLALANAYEKATEWHLRKPPLTAGTSLPPISRAAL